MKLLFVILTILLSFVSCSPKKEPVLPTDHAEASSENHTAVTEEESSEVATDVTSKTAIAQEEKTEVRMRQESSPIVVQKEANPIVFMAPEYRPLGDGMKAISYALMVAAAILGLCFLCRTKEKPSSHRRR